MSGLGCQLRSRSSQVQKGSDGCTAAENMQDTQLSGSSRRDTVNVLKCGTVRTCCKPGSRRQMQITRPERGRKVLGNPRFAVMGESMKQDRPISVTGPVPFLYFFGFPPRTPCKSTDITNSLLAHLFQTSCTGSPHTLCISINDTIIIKPHQRCERR